MGICEGLRRQFELFWRSSGTTLSTVANMFQELRREVERSLLLMDVFIERTLHIDEFVCGKHGA